MTTEAELADKITDAHRITQEAIQAHLGDRVLAGVALLFSGGRDSTTLAHLFRGQASWAIHANTTVGIETTRQFVRDACQAWNLPLLEEYPPESYAERVRAHGFPGPGDHHRTYQRLKERGLRQARRKIIANGHRQRVLFLAGRRRAESARRANLVEHERMDSVIWASPLANWTAGDLAAYERSHPDLPRNDVAALLHLSGECLCGCYAQAGEREEITYWFPEVFAEIGALEAEVADSTTIPEHRKTWGWCALDRHLRGRRAEPDWTPGGQLCSSCEHRWESPA